MRINWRLVAGAALSLAAVVAMLWRVDWAELRKTVAGANYWWLLPFLALEVLVIWKLRKEVPMPVQLDIFHIMDAVILL